MRDELAIWHTKNGVIRAEWNFTNLTVYLNGKTVGMYLRPETAMALVNELASEVVWSLC